MTQLKSVVLASLIAIVSAHQNLHQFWINDVSPGFEIGIRRAPSNSPVTDVTSNDIVCNVGGTSGTGVQTIEAKAGDKITVQWDQSTHPGPITHMLHGPVSSASSATGVGSWFKIDELNSEGGKWANEIMSAADMKHTFTIPAGVASGEYLLRSEMLALHGAQTIGGAQFYIGCMQLKITGGSAAAKCGPEITLPGAYKEDDENIYIPNVYNGFDISSYKAPGGEVATCGAGSGGAPAPAEPATSAVASITQSATLSISTTAAPTAVATSAATEEEYPEETATPIATPTTTAAEEVPTPTATQTVEETTPEPTKPSESVPSSTPTSAPSLETDLPAGTKLSSVLSWLSKFYAANGEKFDNETALKRRHARHF